MDLRLLITTVFLIGVLGVVPVSQTALPVPPAGEPPVFSAQSELVVLQVMVEDRTHAYVTNLSADAFTVREDGVPQMVEFFNRLDAPVTVGLLIDGSGSMASVRNLVAAAAGTFVATSNPEDEAFALMFNEYVRPALSETEPFTSDGPTLRAALLEALFARGRTALYDAIVNGLQYGSRGMHERRVLVAISDGGDNASAATFDVQHIARDIRNMYTIGYAPSRSGGDGLRRIRVTVEAPNHAMLRVRTRQGYMVEKR